MGPPDGDEGRHRLAGRGVAPQAEVVGVAELLGVSQADDHAAPFHRHEDGAQERQGRGARADLHHEPPRATPARSGPSSGPRRRAPTLSRTVVERDTQRSATPVTRDAAPAPTQAVERSAAVRASWSRATPTTVQPVVTGQARSRSFFLHREHAEVRARGETEETRAGRHEADVAQRRVARDEAGAEHGGRCHVVGLARARRLEGHEVHDLARASPRLDGRDAARRGVALRADLDDGAPRLEANGLREGQGPTRASLTQSSAPGTSAITSSHPRQVSDVRESALERGEVRRDPRVARGAERLDEVPLGLQPAAQRLLREGDLRAPPRGGLKGVRAGELLEGLGVLALPSQEEAVLDERLGVACPPRAPARGRRARAAPRRGPPYAAWTAVTLG